MIILLNLLSPILTTLPQFTDVTSNLDPNADFSVITGYVPITIQNISESGLFYQFVSKVGQKYNQSINTSTPLVFWFNGGPGSASQFGSWCEIGPFQYSQKNQIKNRSQSWNKKAHLIFIDQPVSNVGLSYCNDTQYLVNNTKTAGQHFVQFMKLIFTTGYLAQLKDNPIYILGQSYGGHYAPYFTHLMLNELKDQFNIGSRLKGLALADGWVDPPSQIMYHGMFKSWGFYSQSTADKMVLQQGRGQQLYYEGRYEKSKLVFDSLTNENVTDPLGGVSIYNLFKYNQIQSNYSSWINGNKEKYGVPQYVNYSQGNQKVYNAFAKDIVMPYTQYLQQALEQIPVLVYNGQLDIIVNTPGIYNYISQLKWKGISNWKASVKQIWKLNSQVVGTAKYYGNLTVVVVNLAGHMVPADQPQPAMNLLQHWINNDHNWSG